MLELIKSKWTTRVLFELDGKTLRFNELRLAIGQISQKTLTAVLRQLEQDGLVGRQAFTTIPPRVDYSLTENGRRCAAAFRQLEQTGLALAGVSPPPPPSGDIAPPKTAERRPRLGASLPTN